MASHSNLTGKRSVQFRPRHQFGFFLAASISFRPSRLNLYVSSSFRWMGIRKNVAEEKS